MECALFFQKGDLKGPVFQGKRACLIAGHFFEKNGFQMDEGSLIAQKGMHFGRDDQRGRIETRMIIPLLISREERGPCA